MATDRSGGRNVHIYDANDRHNPDKRILGGLILVQGTSISDFFYMLHILFLFETTFALENEEGFTIESSSHQLQPGNYYIAGKFILCSTCAHS